MWCIGINFEFYGIEFEQNKIITWRKLKGKRSGI